MAFTPVQKVSAYESIVLQIESAVERGELKPGDRLPGERKLMTDFSVSRATVREALRVLQATGLIESRPGDPRGAVISHYSPRLLEKSMSQLARLDSVSRGELLQFRLILESSACRLAARDCSEEDLTLIEQRLRELQDSVAAEGAEHFSEHVSLFQAAIRRASRNQLLEVTGNVVGGIMSELLSNRLSTDADRIARVRRSAQDAARLVEAIRAREPEQASAIQVENIYRFYADDLDDAERDALAQFIAGVEEPISPDAGGRGPATRLP